MKKLFLVTPAYKRFELSEICFAQHVQVARVLSLFDLEVKSVIVADDKNIDIALSLGMDVVETDNEFLGKKFNDGIEYACNHGADFVVPIGSDSWIDPLYFVDMPDDGTVQSSNYFTAFDPLGIHRVELFVKYRNIEHGVGPYVIPRYMLEPCGFRPAEDRLHKGVDYSTITGIEKYNKIEWRMENNHFSQYTTFKSADVQITNFERLVNRHMIKDVTQEPFLLLYDHYPAPIVEQVEKMYEERRNLWQEQNS